MIPFNNLLPAIEPIRKDVDRAIARVIDRGVFVNGPESAAFEEEWAKYCGAEYCVTCANGTDALGAAAFACSKKILYVQSNTLPATAHGLSRGGAEVRFIDCTSGLGVCPNIETIDEGWVPVGLYGQCLSDPVVSTLGFIDACQLHGLKCKGLAAWSFYPTKNLGGCGEGGAVTTSDAVQVNSARSWVTENTSRMHEIQAAILRVKLPHLSNWNGQRGIRAFTYHEELGDMCVVNPDDGNHHLFPILCKDRTAVTKKLDEHEIGWKVHYPVPLHIHFGGVEAMGQCPNAEWWCNHVLSLPMWPGLTNEQVRTVCDVVKSA